MKTEQEQAAAERAAQAYIEASHAGAMQELKTALAKSAATTPISNPSNVDPTERKIISCTLAHSVAIRGTETRTVALAKLDYQSAGLEIQECDRGLQISYKNTRGQRESFITPWANVVEYRFGA